MGAVDFAESKPPKPYSVVKKFRDTHHLMARMFALGMRPGEVADRMGYSLSRISILRNTPAFEELIQSYRGEVDAAWRQRQDEYIEIVTRTKMIAARMKLDRIETAEENGEEIPLGTLLRIEGDAADRTGYAKRTVNVNVNLDLVAKLDRARERSKKVMKEIEGTVIDAPMVPAGFTRRV